MKRVALTATRSLLAIAIALLLMPSMLRPFLDRIYYRGSASDHFDGVRFFNPEDRKVPHTQEGGFSPARLAGFVLGRDRVPWPTRVPVTPTVPPTRVVGRALRVTWIGHSTVLLQTDGLNILTDPVWSDVAGPWGVFGPRRVRAPGVRLADLPRIDLILVSHDHYDHMDLDTLAALWRRDRPLIVTGLGNDTILRSRGAPAQARDWGGHVPVRPGVDVIVERVHHWGTRWGADRNRSLWCGFTITLPGGNLFFAGDTGWGDGAWVKQDAKDGPYRLAIIPIGAILPRALMAPNHIEPGQSVQVFQGLGARFGLGVHWGTFHLSDEPFDAPPKLLRAALARQGIAPDRFRTTLPGQAWMVP